MSIETAFEGGQTNPYSSVYYEMGLSERWTVGLDAGTDMLGYSSALLFARTSVWQRQGGGRVAAEIALGGVLGSTSGQSFALRPGLSWGRGIGLYQGGWVAVDATYGYKPSDNTSLAKVETTLGLNHGQRIKLMLQATVEKPSGQGTSVSVTPGLAYRFGDEFHLITGVVAYKNRSTALKIGLWREY
ncbi:hypothetical protein [Shimia gijangensis]|nr:hypothetical protein [Shimia gijangensis]